MDVVFETDDLVICILQSVHHLRTLKAAARVCKAWHRAVLCDPHHIHQMALLAAPLLKTAFCQLFGLTTEEASAYPHKQRSRFKGGVYYLYGKPAIELAHREVIDVVERRERRVRMPPRRIWDRVECRVVV